MSSNPVSLPSSQSFDGFALHSKLTRALAALDYAAPRPIQAATLEPALSGRDILGLAETGTGKTCAFALPILDRCLGEPSPGPVALVLAPTRELASQIQAEIGALARFTRIRSITLFGGVGFGAQLGELRRDPEIVVGCPGRVLDLMQRGDLRCDRIHTLVLDEADFMFDMGFLPDLRRILERLPSDRQNLLFSATMPEAIHALAKQVLRDPYVARLSQSAPAETVDHALYPIAEGDKLALLERMLGDAKGGSAIVFTRTKHRARRLAEKLGKLGHRALCLQGNMSQNQRERAMQSFRDRQCDILVATDIVARGIDVSSVSHVINFDVPTTPEAYTHRIGRTGRSGRSGRASTFVTLEDAAWVRATERMIGHSIPREQVAGFTSVRAVAQPEAERAPRGRGGAPRPATTQRRRRRPRR